MQRESRSWKRRSFHCKAPTSYCRLKQASLKVSKWAGPLGRKCNISTTSFIKHFNFFSLQTIFCNFCCSFNPIIRVHWICYNYTYLCTLEIQWYNSNPTLDTSIVSQFNLTVLFKQQSILVLDTFNVCCFCDISISLKVPSPNSSMQTAFGRFKPGSCFLFDEDKSSPIHNMSYVKLVIIKQKGVPLSKHSTSIWSNNATQTYIVSIFKYQT